MIPWGDFERRTATIRPWIVHGRRREFAPYDAVLLALPLDRRGKSRRGAGGVTGPGPA